MEEIIVRSQAELDAISTDYNGRIIIEFGTPYNRAVVNRRFKRSVEALGNSSVEARDRSSVEARDNSSVEAWDRSSVVARDNSSVVARDRSSVDAWDRSSVDAWDRSSVVAWDNSSVVAWDNSSVVARDRSSVVAWDRSSVVARDNSQVTDRSYDHDIKVSGNARIVYDPKTINEYLDFHGVEHDEATCRLFKAVHKIGDKYISDYDTSFTYVVGETVVPANGFDDAAYITCGPGIHIAHKRWSLDFGRNWKDLAILEVEAEIASIVVPTGGDGKVRAPSVKVIREVPLEECGLYGKILAKRRAAE